MNITPTTMKTSTYNKPAFSGHVVPNKYVENCIQYTLKSNDNLKTKNLITSLNALLNDGTDRSFEFDAALKSSSKGLKYIPTVKIDSIKQPLKLQAKFSFNEINNKNLAEECISSIDAVIKKCNILNTIKTSMTEKEVTTNIDGIKNTNKDHLKTLKNELENIYKQIFQKAS